jgi:TonB family protein
VLLEVTIGADGTITAARVLESSDPALESAALETIRKWKFQAATRDGVAIAATVPVEMAFEAPPSNEPAAAPAPTATATAATAPSVEVPAATAPREVPAATATNASSAPTESSQTPQTPIVDDEGEYSARGVADAESLRARSRGSADFSVDRNVLTAAPHRDAGSMLLTLPGVYVAKNEGAAVADSITLRGFDAEHGQDIEMLVDGVPINQPSHMHGQGYADLGFLIPEVVREIRITEGVYDPRQGDFATAGTIDFALGVDDRGIHSLTSYGSFDTVRQALIYAPKDERPDTFGAAAYRQSAGFGENRGGTDAQAIAQYGFGEGNTRYRATGMLSGARYGQAGVLRRDDIASGRVGYYDVYPLATAEAQNASSARSQLSFTAEKRGAAGDNSELLLFTTYNDFRLLENYTGFLDRSRVNPEWVGRGDLIEQTSEQLTFGARARHRTAPYRPVSSLAGTLELGLATRLDQIDQTQNLLGAPQNEIWDLRVDASITGADIGAYVDADIDIAEIVSVKGGFRVDALYYDVNDRLGNVSPAFRSEEHIPGFRRSSMGIAAGPRVSTEVKVLPWLSALAAYGEGYRSPQARTLTDGETAPFAKVKSADVGAHARFEDYLTASVSGFWTRLGDDVAFDAAEGRLEPIGPTTRLGVVFASTVRPTSWSLLNASLTTVRATLDEPPPPTAEDPSPPFESGSALPYVPPVTARLDLSVTPHLADIAGAPLRGRAGVGYSFLSPRPLPFGDESDAVSLFDALLGARYRELELLFEMQNILDSEYAASEFNFTSAWDPDAIPSRVPARHIAAGAPRTFLATLGIHL